MEQSPESHRLTRKVTVSSVKGSVVLFYLDCRSMIIKASHLASASPGHCGEVEDRREEREGEGKEGYMTLLD